MIENPEFNSFTSYSSILNVGHKTLRESGFFDSDVYVEEKLDGSQFSFGLIDGELRMRSKGAIIYPEAPEKMFAAAVATARELLELKLLRPGWTYRCEYLAKPKHNTLAYLRIPAKHLCVFDINTGPYEFLSYEAKKAEAELLGLEVVPLVFQGRIHDAQEFRSLIDRESLLGGQKIEGVVCKRLNYDLLGADKKPLMAKFVSEAFRESHTRAWSESNPGQTDVLAKIAQQHGTQARWMKAVQHLKERGELTDTPKDIGGLIREVPLDVLKECKEEMQDALWQWAWPHIKRQLTSGLPEWYKEQLVKTQFEEEAC